MVLSVWSSPPTVCPPVRRCSAPTPSLFPRSAGRPAADCLPAGWGRCQDTHRRTDAHAYLHVRATAHTLTHSHKSNAWPSSLPSQHALWLPGCCPASIRTRFCFLFSAASRSFEPLTQSMPQCPLILAESDTAVFVLFCLDCGGFSIFHEHFKEKS